MTAHQGDASRSLILTGQATFYDDKTSAYSDAQNVALTYKGPFNARLKDETGIDLGRIDVNKDAIAFNHLIMNLMRKFIMA